MCVHESNSELKSPKKNRSLGEFIVVIKKQTFLSVLSLTAILFCANTMAQTFTGKVTQVWVNQKVWFKLDTMETAQIDTACNTTARFAVDATTDKGKNIYSALLTAKSTDSSVTVVGTGTCTAHHDSEDVAYVLMQ